MRLALLLLASLAIALPSCGQSPGDTVRVVVPADRNCSDFEYRIPAQAHYLRMQFLTGAQDPHGLDADGNGQACESIEKIRRVQVDDSLWYDTVERPQTLRCVDTTFAFPDYLEDTRGAMWGEGDHQELHKMRGCVDVLNSFQQVP